MTAAPVPSQVEREARARWAKAVEELRKVRDALPKLRLYPSYLGLGSRRRRATRIEAPKVLSLRDARRDFLSLIYQHRWTTWVELPPWARRFETVIVDLATTEQLTLDAALVLTAEFHNACLIAGLKDAYRPTIDDADWHPNVRGLLKTLGFYELVQAAEWATGIADPAPGTLRFVPFVSEEKVLGRRADEVLEALRAAAGQTPAREAAYSALIEAINNVRGHAYPADAPPAVDRRLPRWWSAGAYDPARGVLEFAVYDRGVGIASTLPRQPFFRSVLRLTAPERTDADVIAAAIRYGRSRHRVAKRKGDEAPKGRGNGLWTICRIVEELDGSFVRITSERGQVEYHGRKDVRKTDYDNPFCGTLIEWTLKLPSEPAAEAGEE